MDALTGVGVLTQARLPPPNPTLNPSPNPHPSPSPSPNPKQDGNVWDPFALELINAASEEDIKRRDLYDGAPLLATLNPQRLLSPWAKVS